MSLASDGNPATDSRYQVRQIVVVNIYSKLLHLRVSLRISIHVQADISGVLKARCWTACSSHDQSFFFRKTHVAETGSTTID